MWQLFALLIVSAIGLSFLLSQDSAEAILLQGTFVDDNQSPHQNVPDWETTLSAAGALGVIAKMGMPVAYWAVLPFLDAYQVVGDELEALTRPFDEKRFLKACLARARMYRIEEKLISGESASQVLFKSALNLAANRELIEDSPDIEGKRSEFATEIREARNLAAAGISA